MPPTCGPRQSAQFPALNDRSVGALEEAFVLAVDFETQTCTASGERASEAHREVLRASSDFIAKALQPLLEGYKLRSELESLPDAGRGFLFELPAGEIQFENEILLLVPVLMEPAKRCLYHLRNVSSSVAPQEVSRAGMAEYFSLQQRVISCLDKLVERSRCGDFRAAPLQIGIPADQMDASEPATIAADDWLFRPLPEHDKHLSIVFLLCDSIYAAMKSSMAVCARRDTNGLQCDPEILAECSQARAEEMLSLCQVLVDIASNHAWSAQDAGLLQHMMDLYDELCLQALARQHAPLGDGMLSGILPARTCQHHASCAIMLASLLTNILPNPAWHVRSQSMLAGQVEVVSVLEHLAKTTGGAEEGRQSGAMAHLHLLLACGELEAMDLGAGGAGSGAEMCDMPILKGMSIQMQQRALLHLLQLLNACDFAGNELGHHLKEMTLGVWGTMLEAGRCVSSRHQHAPEDPTSPGTMDLEGGGICWPAMEVTSKLVEALPKASVRVWSSWQVKS